MLELVFLYFYFLVVVSLTEKFPCCLCRDSCN